MELGTLGKIVEEKGGQVYSGNWFDIRPESYSRDTVLVIKDNNKYEAELKLVDTTKEMFDLRDQQRGRFQVLAAYIVDIDYLQSDGRVRECLK